MSAWLIALVGAIYMIVSIDSAYHGKYDISLMFLGYAIAQVAVYWIATKG
jgi:hypothetical protein